MTEANNLSGPFGRGGQRVVRAELRFDGILGERFAVFLDAVTARLSLEARIDCGASVAIVEVTGRDALIGVREMAARVGPEGCLITGWSCNTEPAVMTS